VLRSELADHQVKLDPKGSETEVFGDLYRFLRRRADPDRQVASEAEWVRRVGAWIGSVALGDAVGRAMVAAAPVTVRVPAGAEFLAFRPWELAHVAGMPLAARSDVALAYHDARRHRRGTHRPLSPGRISSYCGGTYHGMLDR
jgi:hypothetical protein